jgi:hypothetical protein
MSLNISAQDYLFLKLNKIQLTNADSIASILCNEDINIQKYDIEYKLSSIDSITSREIIDFFKNVKCQKSTLSEEAYMISDYLLTEPQPEDINNLVNKYMLSEVKYIIPNLRIFLASISQKYLLPNNSSEETNKVTQEILKWSIPQIKETLYNKIGKNDFQNQVHFVIRNSNSLIF